MNCIPEETAMLYVESELEDVSEVEAHLAGCDTCQDLIGLLRQENAALASVLREPAPNRRMQALAHLAGSIAASVTVAVPAQWAAARIGEMGMWMNHIGGLPFELAFRTVRAFAPLVLLVALTQVMAPAMTRRAGQGAVVIGSQETIRDSVLATGESVLVEGKIEGNLFMFGRSLEVRGEVDGDVITGGQEVRITGKVTGNVLAGAETITVSGHVNGSVYAGGRNVHVERGGVVERDVLSGSETVTIEGDVGRGLTAGGSTAVIAGTLGRGLTFGGEKILIRSGGKIGGDIIATMPDRNSVQVDPGAVVTGKTDVTLEEKSVNTGVGFGRYLWEAAVLVGAFLVGWLLLTGFPGFYGGTLQRVLSWPSAGIGFAAVFLIPIIVVILCITVIGLPVGVAALLLFGAGLYLAKIIVAGYLGRELFRSQNGLPSLLGLFVGLALLQAVFFVPYGGGLMHFVVYCLGLGALALQMKASVFSGPSSVQR